MPSVEAVTTHRDVGIRSADQLDVLTLHNALCEVSTPETHLTSGGKLSDALSQRDQL